MKKHFFYILIFILISCNQKNYYEEFYKNGVTKLKIEIDKNSIRNGNFEEYYEIGQLKAIGKYINGEVVDFVYVYYPNGKIREKGKFKNGYRSGWFDIFREDGTLMKKEEYLNVEKKYIKNQFIFYNANGKIDYSKSSFFILNVPDTIKLGKNKLTLNYYDNSTKSDHNFLNVIIENKYSENKIKKDTFTDGTRNPFFGVYAYKKGPLTISGIIEEKILTEKKIHTDSAELTVEDKYKFFKKNVYVTDK
jgi:hypothetical protein